MPVAGHAHPKFHRNVSGAGKIAGVSRQSPFAPRSSGHAALRRSPLAHNRYLGGTAVSWDFETEPEFQKQLDWIEKFVREEVEPLDYILGSPYDVRDANRNKLVRPLQEEVRKHKLWACHLEPELGGQGYGQVKLALMNEILGPSRFAP